ncbi:TetR/AcrR family transcriptional regulator [Pseudovibrio sp. Tun.PSC04-5.I4]|uniref:TetR/AcrR family transcriptional regulator n=1 Tax=Pseudovibrio sp. Tun.PSC04-5.I4 TaxID=1798213 RepID=UPI00088CF240|nr:TetR/AcrR family transcriptional regulator [Pseudovibrio sp. Tun.PSC04-5.I4]SDQ95708.1 DNA-binding transcriptional regulator, AcrR family [Pseudovibrio sp. Tun.PSC04-5.I4]
MSQNNPTNDGELTPDLESMFDNCVQVFLRLGYETSTMDDLAKAGKVSRPFLDQRYSSKTDLTVAALKWYYTKYGRQMTTAMATHSDISAAMEAGLVSFIEISYDQIRADKRLFVRTLIDISYVDEGVKAAFDDMRNDWEVQVKDKFAQCQNEFIDPTEIDVLLHYFLTLVEGTYQLIKYGTPSEIMYKVALLSVEVLDAHMKSSHLNK